MKYQNTIFLPFQLEYDYKKNEYIIIRFYPHDGTELIHGYIKPYCKHAPANRGATRNWIGYLFIEAIQHSKYNFLCRNCPGKYIDINYIKEYNEKAIQILNQGFSKKTYEKYMFFEGGDFLSYYLNIMFCLYYYNNDGINVPIEMVMFILTFVTMGDVYITLQNLRKLKSEN